MRHVALFVDCANIYFHVGKRFGRRRIDYRKLLQLATGEDHLVRATAYVTHGNRTSEDFIICLKNLGYEVKRRVPQKQESNDPNTVVIMRSDWGLEMALDIARTIENKKLDIIYLVTSNPDFIPIVEYIKNHGVRCVLISCRIGDRLRDAASSIIEIKKELLELENNNAEVNSDCVHTNASSEAREKRAHQDRTGASQAEYRR